MMIADSIGFAGTHSIAAILSGVPGLDVVHGTQNFTTRGPIGTNSQSADEFAATMSQAGSGQRPIVIHTNLPPAALKPACDRRGIWYGLIARHPVRQIESCYAWAMKKTLDGAPDSLVMSLKTGLNVLQQMQLPINLPNVTYVYAAQHVCTFNLAAVALGAPVMRMEELLQDEPTFRAAFDIPAEVDLPHFGDTPQHLAQKRSDPALAVVADPARAEIIERLTIQLNGRAVAVPELTQALGY